jgi:N-acylneuraminate cytidylyltransferase
MKIAIIPARGGSKRIPRKNIKDFLGKPIIAYSIETAIESNLFDKVVVSTDDEEIAKVARAYGAEVPFVRPRELADDFSGTNSVVKHALNWFLEQDICVDYVCCIYATVPFLGSRYLKEGFEKLQSSNKSFSFSVTSFASPIQRAIKIKDNNISMFFPKHQATRSQDLEESYHDAGQFYWGKAEAFLNDKSLFSQQSYPVILPRDLVQDIDTIEDWNKAELMYKIIQKEQQYSKE